MTPLTPGHAAALNDARLVHGVDADGVPGLMDAGSATAIVGPSPMGDGWRWSFAAAGWVRMQSLADVKAAALAAIDAAAGAARLRYITDVPGQQAVYLLKLQEAEALIDAPASEPGPHITAEAAATNSTPAAVAQLIASTAAYWNAIKSPAIEGARLGGKAAVAAAETEAEANAACDAALAALAAI